MFRKSTRLRFRIARAARMVIRAADPDTVDTDEATDVREDSVGPMLNDWLNIEMRVATMYQVFAGALRGLHSAEFREFYEEQLPSDDPGLLMDHMLAEGYAVELRPIEVEHITDVSAALRFDHDVHDSEVLPLLDRIRAACGDSPEHAATLMLTEDMMAEETTHRDRLARLLAENAYSLTAKVAPDMSQERPASLVLKLETAIIRKLDKIPSTAPIAVQLVEYLSSIKAELEPKAGLTGRDAVEAFLRAVEGRFLPDFPPLRSLARKYPEIAVDLIGGTMSLPAEP